MDEAGVQRGRMGGWADGRMGGWADSMIGIIQSANFQALVGATIRLSAYPPNRPNAYR